MGGVYADLQRPEADAPDFFGDRVVYRADESTRCLPHESFERWAWHCELFGDIAEFVGVIDTAEGLRVVIRQRFVEGTPATDEEIDRFFRGNLWKPFSWAGNLANFDEQNRLVVSDTHRGNLVKTAEGRLAPIDLRIQKIDGAVLDAVRRSTA